MFTPILNGQEVRILEVKRSVKELVVKDSKATLLQKEKWLTSVFHMTTGLLMGLWLPDSLEAVRKLLKMKVC